MSTDGTTANERSGGPSISADGRYVAFSSWASNIVPGDANDTEDAFVHDTLTGATTRVSLDLNGEEANGQTTGVSISPDGRHLAFFSNASDLVGDDLNGTWDVFVRDLQAGTTDRASIRDSDTEANDASFTARYAVSNGGRYVVFQSFANNLTANDTSRDSDVFVRDVQSGTTTLVSVSTSGGNSDGFASSAAVTPDGRYVAFDSDGTNLVAEDENGFSDVFVRDLQAQMTTRVSVATDGGDSDGPSHQPDITPDGRYVAFHSQARNVAPGSPDNFTVDVFRRDRHIGTTIVASGYTTGACGGFDPSISDDGRYVAFDSCATDLVPDDRNDATDVFVRDLSTGRIERASTTATGREATGGDSTFGVLSGDGRYVTFSSGATNLVKADTGFHDVFVRSVFAPRVTAVAPASLARGDVATVDVTGIGFLPNAAASANAWGPGGSRVTAVHVVSDTQLELEVVVAADAPLGTRNLVVWNPGTGAGAINTGYGFCIECLTITEGT